MDFFRNLKNTFSVFVHSFVHSRPLQAAFFTVLILFSWCTYFFLIRAPHSFPVSTYISIESGETLSGAANALENAHVIDHPLVFKIISKILSPRAGIKAGNYFFERPKGLAVVAFRLARGDFNIKTIKVTIPEGSTVFDIAKILSNNLPQINEKKFATSAKADEGYLFPDTYYLLPTDSETSIVSLMRKNFDDHIAPLQDKIKASGHSLKDVISMASLLEEEARTTESREIISGILWKRISIGMPLQVDATFQYINGKNTFQLTQEDLQSSSPYNTYKFKGLPPGPISSPGVDAITAALSPVKTKYFYYLSDKNGDMHYATTFDEHVRNKTLYLR